MTKSYTLTNEQIASLEAKYSSYRINTTNEYQRSAFKLDDCTIIIYESKKVVFQGKDIAVYIKEFETKEDKEPLVLPQAGSDEVGTGDYFGPMVVCAAYVDQKTYDLVKNYNIDDSKKITDKYILEIMPSLLPHLTYSCLVVTNEKYNVVHRDNNLNAMKAKLHNQAYLNLKKKITKLPKLCVVDQFCEPGIYYHYLKSTPEVEHSLYFTTKAESKYIAVALASMIARYKFLEAWEELNASYSFEFPKGAGNTVDEAIAKFVETHGVDELYKVAKVHFKNTEQVTKKVLK